MANLHAIPDTPVDKRALEKMGPQPENFYLYCWEWMEKRPPFRNFRITGAVFREAKRGPNKGKLCVKVPGTDRAVYFTEQELIELK